ncbi:equilibrative nucleoside transporter 3-like [Sitophilus oryzae]|uniref:Equilibrative nucleoside transporter 3-like n=1 Tax=Sitophilus oryzae TaxID=7048 RepID=A0A6J2Y6J3_SITOR|nr:equilibrative nucleoside transporter 3-like [Sitophilus oryzae]
MEAEIVEAETITKVAWTEDLPEPKAPPKDKYLICHILFFLLGIVHILPISFLASANNFWLHKFRNVSDTTESDDNRTALQSYFSSARSVINTVPWVLLGIWNVLYGHRFKMMPKIIVTLIIETTVFAILTAFVEINTDSYQATFFGIALLSSAVLTAGNVVNIFSSTMLYPKFPHNYMKTCMMGEAASGIVCDILNVISVAIFSDVNDAALMYFLIGTFILAFTLGLLLLVSKMEFFQYCITSFPEDIKKKKTTNSDMKVAFKKIWIGILILMLVMGAMGSTHTSITSLVVSEGSGVWAKKYFSPVATFLLSDIFLLLGRFASSYIPVKIPEPILCAYSAFNALVFVPAIIFCNAKPRKHLSVLFPHDWEYALILGLFMLGNGYLFNTAITNIPRKTTKEESEVAFNIFNLFVGVAQMISNPVGLLFVKLL